MATTPALSTAAQLLFATAAFQPDRTALRRLIDTGIDWDGCCALADRERAAPVLLRHVDPLLTATEREATAELRTLARAWALRMLRYEQLLHHTLDELESIGIEAMLLKGAAIGTTVYPSLADRPMGDLDLLVRPEDARRAWSHLQDRGWYWPSDRWTEDSYRSHQHLPPLLQDPGEFRLEIHTQLLPGEHPFAITTDALWSTATRVERGGRTFLVPDASYQAWHIAVHFVWQHIMTWGAWRAVRDTAALVATGDLAWSGFTSLARDSRAQSCCYWTLRLTRSLTGADVPAEVLGELRPPGGDVLTRALEGHHVLAIDSTSPGCPSLWLSRRLWEMAVRPGWSGHGVARPWQVSERWGRPQQPEPDQQGGRSALAKVLGLGDWVMYAGRVGRVQLPF